MVPGLRRTGVCAPVHYLLRALSRPRFKRRFAALLIAEVIISTVAACTASPVPAADGNVLDGRAPVIVLPTGGWIARHRLIGASYPP